MSTESIDAACGGPLLVPLLVSLGLSVTTVPPNGREITHLGRSETLWKEALIATLCCFPIGIISLCYSLEVNHQNNMGDYARAYKASRRTESLVRCTYRCSALLYVILGLLLLGLIEGGILVGIGVAHTSSKP